MIPEDGVKLDAETAGRWNLTKMAAVLVRAGVPAALVMSDCREGCDLASRRPQ